MKEVVKDWMIYRMENPARDGVCAIEILELDDGRKVVILEELEENPGFSVSQAWERVVATVREKYNLLPENSVWIEHNTEPVRTSEGLMPRWQLVTFKQPRRGDESGNVEWREMRADDWHELGLEPRL